MENLFKSKKFLALVIVIIILAVILYTYFLKPSVPNNAPLASITETGSESNSMDEELFQLLSRLRLMDKEDGFDSGILEDERFLNLQDFSREIPTVSAGRRNPFLSIGIDPQPFVKNTNSTIEGQISTSSVSTSVSTSTVGR